MLKKTFRDINNRPKRSTQYSFTAGSDSDEDTFEIPEGILRREHRSGYTEDDSQDYEDSLAPAHAQHHESRRVTVTQTHSRRSNPSPSQEVGGEKRKRTRVPNRKFTAILQGQEAALPVPTAQVVAAPEYDAFRYQNDRPQVTREAQRENSDSAEPYIQTPPKTIQISMTSSLSSPNQPYVSAEKPKQNGNGRKIRVLLRSRKNETNSDTPSPTATPVLNFPEFKAKPDGKLPHKTKSTPPRVEKTTTTTVAPTTPAPTRKITRPTTVRTASPVVTSTTKPSAKSLQAHLSQRDPSLLQTLNENRNGAETKLAFKSINTTRQNEFDLSPNGPVVGLLSSVVKHGNESEACQKRALCELAIRGTNPSATKFETFMWTLATL